jgi:radical SAM protein
VSTTTRLAAGSPAVAPSLDFDRTPFTVIWEATRACDLRCRHCRADAQPWRDPRELDTSEAKALLGQIRDLASPVFVITGGDPLKRPDLEELVTHARQIGLRVALTPSGTPLLTAQALERLRDAGVERIALSLDGPSAAVHDWLRGQPGSFAVTEAAIRHARELGLPVQVNTAVTRSNLGCLDAIATRLARLDVAMWSLFFLVTVGRAERAELLGAEEFERVFAFLYERSPHLPFATRTTAAPHYRRFVLQRARDARRAAGGRARPWLAGVAGPRARRGVTDGNGIVFVSHRGDVFPSGFLPVSVGQVREQPLAEIYRGAFLMRRLRNPDALGGKCGVCEFRRVCGGSRARAYAHTGDPMAEEPCCAYVPRGSRPGSALTIGT